MPETSSQDTHTVKSTKGEFKEYYISEYHNYYIIQVSHIKCHILIFSSAITINSEVINYMSTELY